MAGSHQVYVSLFLRTSHHTAAGFPWAKELDIQATCTKLNTPDSGGFSDLHLRFSDFRRYGDAISTSQQIQSRRAKSGKNSVGSICFHPNSQKPSKQIDINSPSGLYHVSLAPSLASALNSQRKPSEKMRTATQEAYAVIDLHLSISFPFLSAHIPCNAARAPFSGHPQNWSHTAILARQPTECLVGLIL